MKKDDGIARRTDHLGNIYKSINKMCDSYSIESYTYRNRIKRGWDKEKALTTPIKPSYQKSKREKLERRTDHLGHTFPTIRDMAEHWGVKRTTFLKRLSSGMSVREALETETKLQQKSCVDHLGNKFKNHKEMCEFYGILETTFYRRMNLGLSIEEALTTPIRKKQKEATDHLGNSYKTISEMCHEYGIKSSTYLYRRRMGWNVEEALTVPIRR